ncbi:MAG TPA: hypothetical protein VGQ19_12725 [Burkholderiales bacterium]|jgi:hypothetical protein|nr:hypothetical protein [Burkholderiales bacterium]
MGVAFAHKRLELIVLRATPDELAAHAQQLEDIDKVAKGACLWKKLERTVGGCGKI